MPTGAPGGKGAIIVAGQPLFAEPHPGLRDSACIIFGRRSAAIPDRIVNTGNRANCLRFDAMAPRLPRQRELVGRRRCCTGQAMLPGPPEEIRVPLPNHDRGPPARIAAQTCQRVGLRSLPARPRAAQPAPQVVYQSAFNSRGLEIAFGTLPLRSQPEPEPSHPSVDENECGGNQQIAHDVRNVRRPAGGISYRIAGDVHRIFPGTL